MEAQTQNIENAHGAMRYGEAWKTVNNVTGRKKAKEGQVSGDSPKKRVETWFLHFKKLLGDPLKVDDPDEEIKQVLDPEELGIDDGLFALEEYRKVKASLKLGKAAGPDNIPLELYKSCDFDEICLNFCNKALSENDSGP